MDGIIRYVLRFTEFIVIKPRFMLAFFFAVVHWSLIYTSVNDYPEFFSLLNIINFFMALLEFNIKADSPLN